MAKHMLHVPDGDEATLWLNGDGWSLSVSAHNIHWALFDMGINVTDEQLCELLAGVEGNKEAAHEIMWSVLHAISDAYHKSLYWKPPVW